MPYFTHIEFGEPHEPKTIITATHSYNEDKNGEQIVNVFEYSVEKQDGEGYKDLKWSAEAVKIQIKALIFVYGIDNSNTEKI